MTVTEGAVNTLPLSVRYFVQKWSSITSPKAIHICDGSEKERLGLLEGQVAKKSLVQLKKYQNCYLARTDCRDVARVESKTFICTNNKRSSVTIGKEGCEESIGLWMEVSSMEAKLLDLFHGCMNGRTMYVLPFCMGPLGSPLAKVGVQLTDSAYVAASMSIMTRMGSQVYPYLDSSFVKCIHSVGLPLYQDQNFQDPIWPCNPEKTVIAHFPDSNEVFGYGSGYGGNSLLSKKGFSLRLGSKIAKDEGWLAEHMLILGLTSPENKKIYIAAAFPSACGKTNLSMMTSSLPGWKVTCLGDDIAWMKFDNQGRLRAINPENGFFGVCPGTNTKSNPVAMNMIQRNTIFTNVCETSEGGVFWEGLEKETDFENLKFTDWQNQNWKPGCKTTAAHPNSRFCTPIENCSILDEKWNDPEGVPISAIIFGGRRPKGIPLVLQAFDWPHGVLIGASVKSETTSAASDVKPNSIQHDPFAMRPFFGYNCGQYFQHWLDIGKVKDRKLPLIFHVNWFLKDQLGNYLWPGFGQNIRVLKWIFDCCEGKENFSILPIGKIPSKDSFDLTGLSGIDYEKIFHYDKLFWKQEIEENRNFFESVIFEDFPEELSDVLKNLQNRVNQE